MGAAPPEVVLPEVEPPVVVLPVVALPVVEPPVVVLPVVVLPVVVLPDVALLVVEPAVSASARAAGIARGPAMPSNAANRPAERACLSETVCIVVAFVRLRGELTGSRLMALRPQ